MLVSSLARIAAAAVVAVSSFSVGEAPRRFAPEFGCVARLPAPHPSGDVIKAHMRISCKRPVATARVEVQLWRLRVWGWEKIGPLGWHLTPWSVRTVDAAAIASASSDECYYYRSTGEGYVITWHGVKIKTPGEGVNYDQRYLKGLPPGCGTKW